MNEIKTVALVDSLWMGHHPMYFKVFVSALAELGIRVLPFCPVPDDLTELLANLRADSSRNGRLQIEPPQAITFPPPSRIRPGRLRPVQQAIRYFGGLGKRLRAWEKANRCKIDLVFLDVFTMRSFSGCAMRNHFFAFPGQGFIFMPVRFGCRGRPFLMWDCCRARKNSLRSNR